MAAYSGAALAAGALSKAIADVFTGLLQGQRGALEAESQLQQLGQREREAALKQAQFPVEMARLQAETGLAEAQRARQLAELERLRALLPSEQQRLEAEIAHLGAQTREAGARSGLYGAQEEDVRRQIERLTSREPLELERLRAETAARQAETAWREAQRRQTEQQLQSVSAAAEDLARIQTKGLVTDADLEGLMRRHPFVFQQPPAALTYDPTTRLRQTMTVEALNEWNAVRRRATAAGRQPTTEELLAFMRRWPLLFVGPQGVPSALHAEITAAGTAASQQAKLFELLQKIDTEANKEAAGIVESVYGKQLAGAPPRPEILETHQWFQKTIRNRMYRASGLADYVQDPGPAPPAISALIEARLRDAFPREPTETIKVWTAGVLQIMRETGADWYSALRALTDALAAPQTRPGLPPRPTPQGRPELPPRQWEYDPRTGNLRLHK